MQHKSIHWFADALGMFQFSVRNLDTAEKPVMNTAYQLSFPRADQK